MEMSVTWKIDLRKKMMQARLMQAPDLEKAANEIITTKVVELISQVSPSCVYCYVDFNHEVSTRKILEYCLEKKITLAVPKVEGKEMSFYQITSMDDLEPGTWGILEPGNHCEPAEDTASLVLVPGVAFTRDGKRLGYGGGYYDKFFEREPKHLKAALAFDFQIVETLVTEDYDVNMDQVITS